MGVEIENNLSVGSMDVNDVINTHNIKVNNQGSLMEIEGDILIKGVLTQENPPSEEVVTKEEIQFTSQNRGHMRVESQRFEDNRNLDIMAFNRT